MTKAAIDNFTEGLAADLGKRGRITVNTLAPGPDRHRHERRRCGRIPDVEKALLGPMTALGRVGRGRGHRRRGHASSPRTDSAWVTGQYLEASGGLGLVPGLG